MSHNLFEIPADDQVLLRLHVQPSAGRTAVSGTHGDALKVRVAAAPEGGRANDACATLVASILGLEDAQVELVSGAASRSKRFRLSRVDPDEIARLLDHALTASGQTRPTKDHNPRF